MDDDYKEQFRDGICTLSFEGIHYVPVPTAKELSILRIHTLDLTGNRLKSLSFLKYIDTLEYVVLDQNPGLDARTLPMLKNLQLLWLNECNILDVSIWVKMICKKCPNLKFLSFMKNPGVKSLQAGNTYAEHEQYRLSVTNHLREICHLDDQSIVRESEAATCPDLRPWTVGQKPVDRPRQMKAKKQNRWTVFMEWFFGPSRSQCPVKHKN